MYRECIPRRIVFYTIHSYEDPSVSVFTLPMDRQNGQGSVTISYVQTPIYDDPCLRHPNGFATWEWLNHTIDDQILPYTDQLGIVTSEGNLTAVTNLDVDFYSPNERYVYQVTEAQGIFLGRRRVIIQTGQDVDIISIV